MPRAAVRAHSELTLLGVTGQVDHLMIFGRRHLEAVLKEFLVHYHYARPHQGLGQRPPGSDSSPWPGVRGDRIVRHYRLGGLLHGQRRAKPA